MSDFRDRINEKEMRIDRERRKHLNFARMYDSNRLDIDAEELAEKLDKIVNEMLEKGLKFDLPRKTFKHKAPNIDRGSEDRTVIKLVIPYASLAGKNDVVPAHYYVRAIENLFSKINHLIIRMRDDMIEREKIIILNAPEENQDILNFNMLLNYLKEYELEEI